MTSVIKFRRGYFYANLYCSQSTYRTNLQKILQKYKKTKSFDNTKAAEQINSLKVLILYPMNRRALYLINILKYILIIIFHVS